jgi:hypothetical protein
MYFGHKMNCTENKQKYSSEFRVYSAPADAASETLEILVRLIPPSLEDNRSDLRRLLESVKQEHGIEIVSAEPSAVHSLPSAARDADWQLMCILTPEPGRGHKLIGFRQNDNLTSEDTL